MKKLILFLAIMSLTICKAQLATAPLQSAGNATAVALLNKIDTTTKVVVKSYTLGAVTYSAANVAMIGTISAIQWSLALGSQYWTLEGAEYTNIGGNYGQTVGTLVFLNDSLTLTDNKAVSPLNVTDYRRQKLLSVLISTGAYQFTPLGCTGSYFTQNLNNSKLPFKGNIWFYMFAGNSGTNSSNQKISLKLVFRKIKN